MLVISLTDFFDAASRRHNDVILLPAIRGMSDNDFVFHQDSAPAPGMLTGQLGTRPKPRPRPERVRPRPRPKKFFEAEAKMYEAEAEARYSRNINHYIGTNCHK